MVSCLTCAEVQEPAPPPQQKKQKGKLPDKVGCHWGRAGLTDRAKIGCGTAGVNVMADANPDVDRAPGSWATTPEIPVFGLIILY